MELDLGLELDLESEPDLELDLGSQLELDLGLEPEPDLELDPTSPSVTLTLIPTLNFLLFNKRITFKYWVFHSYTHMCSGTFLFYFNRYSSLPCVQSLISQWQSIPLPMAEHPVHRSRGAHNVVSRPEL